MQRDIEGDGHGVIAAIGFEVDVLHVHEAGAERATGSAAVAGVVGAGTTHDDRVGHGARHKHRAATVEAVQFIGEREVGYIKTAHVAHRDLVTQGIARRRSRWRDR